MRVLLPLLLLAACGRPIVEDPPPDWRPVLSVEQVFFDGVEEPSSSKLRVRWDLHPEACRHAVRAESEGGHVVGAADETGDLLLGGLRSATEYRVFVEIVPCGDPLAVFPLANQDATTGHEVFRFVGEGADHDGLRRIVDDGNAKFHAIRFGADAPPELAGRLQLYYGASGHQGLSVAVSGFATDDVDSFTGFSSLAGASGLLSPDPGTDLVRRVNTGQAVPLGDDALRLFFEATGDDGTTRILSLDSQDGLAGRDFHAGDKVVCDTAFDYGNPCAPAVEVDPDSELVPADNTRQFRVGVATLDDWRWSQGPDSWMLATVDADEDCGRDAFANQALLTSVDGVWTMHTDDAGCPAVLPDLQAPSPLHVGDGQWKIYGSQPSDRSAALDGSPLPYPGPKSVLHLEVAEGSAVDIAHFEERDQARPVRFEWPSGEPLTDTQVGYLDDYTVLRPTDDPDLQVWYGAVTDGEQMPFGAAAILINP